MTLGGMKKYAGAGAAMMLVVLVLTGCSSESAAPASEVQVAQSAPAASSSSEQAAEPEAAADENDARFVSVMRETSKGLDAMTDDEWVAVGHAACEEMAAGTAIDAVDAIEAEPAEQPSPGWNDTNMAGIAQELYCPEVERTYEG